MMADCDELKSPKANQIATDSDRRYQLNEIHAARYDQEFKARERVLVDGFD